MSDYALELSFDEAGEQAVTDGWLDLRFLGLPSQADHRRMTNAPHLSLVVAREIPDAVRDAAAELIAPMLPARLEIRGHVLFGQGSHVTVAWLAEPPSQLVGVVERLRAMTPALRHPVWTPHVTLGRRIPRARVGDALAGMSDAPPQLCATRLRWWNPMDDSITTIASAGEPST